MNQYEQMKFAKVSLSVEEREQFLAEAPSADESDEIYGWYAVQQTESGQPVYFAECKKDAAAVIAERAGLPGVAERIRNAEIFPSGYRNVRSK